MSTILSGEQLVSAHSRTSQELPTAGLKQFEPSHSWLEQKQIQSVLDERKALIEEERVEKWSCLMTAEWISERHKAEVKQKNKHWEVFGHHSDDVDWLFPEEVLFLMEMNSVECMYGTVPLSIQKGYSLLLRPEEGCSLNEYRVFSHLSRMGYRVVRHLPELTVTAYERQIRLDQHLELRKTYSEGSSGEVEVPRPDLPPKKVLDLPENTEVSMKSKSLFELAPEVKKSQRELIEVIDLADSSSDESSSSDGSIEIVHISAPIKKSIEGVIKTQILKEQEEEEDDDIEIIEVPVPQKKIVVATIESSEGESENESSDSGSDKSDDGNWKRNKPKKKKRCFSRSATMSNLNYLAVEEFCVERCYPQIDNVAGSDNMDGEVVDRSNSTNFLSIHSSLPGRSRTVFPVPIKSRTEILNLMPTMAGQNKKLMSLDCPDLRLIPNTIVPKQESYTFNTNSLRARVFTFRPYRRRRPNFIGYNHQYNNSFTNQSSFGPHVFQAPNVNQMFGSDIQSMARGMMQYASALLLNLPQNNRNSISPFTNQPPVFNNHFSRSDFNPQRIFDETPRNIPLQNPSYSGLPIDPLGTVDNNQQPFQNRSFGNHSFNRRNSGGSSDFERNERTFTPPRKRGRGGGRMFHHNNRFNRPGRPLSRDQQNRRMGFSPVPDNLRPVDHVLPDIDPAYVRPDVPLPDEQNLKCDRSEEFIPLSSHNQSPVEVININDDDVPSGKLISSRFVRKRIRRNNYQKNKKGRMNFKSEPGNSSPDIIFLDSPDVSSSSFDDSMLVKQESICDSTVRLKTEDTPILKQEIGESTSKVDVKREMGENGLVKIEQGVDNGPVTRVKNEGSNEVRVKLEQSGSNLRVEIKVDSSSDTSSVNSLPIASLVKTEPELTVKQEVHLSPESPLKVKTEQAAEMKIERPSEEVEMQEHTIQQLNSISAEINAVTVEDVTHQSECQFHHSVNSATTVNPVSELEVMNDESVPVISQTESGIVSSTMPVGKSRMESEINNESSTKEVTSSSEEVDINTTTLTEKSGCESRINGEDILENTLQTESVNVNSATSMEKSLKESEINEEHTQMVVDILDTTSESVVSKGKLKPDQNISAIDVDLSFELYKNDSLRSSQGKRSELDTAQNSEEMEVDTIEKLSNSEITRNSQSDGIEREISGVKISSWAEVKKQNFPLTSYNSQDEEESDEEEDVEEVRPVLRPKNCKTIGTVLSALQIFSPFTGSVAEEDITKIKISFDMYLSADFRKAHRGLPQYRIVVFGGTDPLPSPAQMSELQSRFRDSVPILRAVVMPDSIVFYSSADISLPLDVTSYRE